MRRETSTRHCTATNTCRPGPQTRGARISLSIACLGLAWPLWASAQHANTAETAPPAPTAQRAPVEVIGKRAADPAIIQTEFIYKVQNIVDKYADGLVQIRWRAYARDNKDDRRGRDSQTPPPLRNGTVMFMDLANGEEREIRYDAEGYLQLPRLTDEQAVKSVITTNQPKGTIGVKLEFKIIPSVGTLTPDMALRTNVALERITGDLKKLMPLALRWLLPSVNGLAVCQSQGEAPGHWRSSKGTHRIVYLYENTKQSQSCAVLHSLEGLPPDARLEVGPSAKLMPWVNGWTGTKAK